MPLIIAADNLNILNPAVAQALNALAPRPLQDLARRCEHAGANLIDINPGFLAPRRHDPTSCCTCTLPASPQSKPAGVTPLEPAGWRYSYSWFSW